MVWVPPPVRRLSNACCGFYDVFRMTVLTQQHPPVVAAYSGITGRKLVVNYSYVLVPFVWGTASVLELPIHSYKMFYRRAFRTLWG